MNPTTLSPQHHYPFGMLIPGRQWSAGSEYRFGFNGKESDAETYGEGNAYDYGFRIYNPRLGKFLSVDPLISSFPELTPYQFASNSPIENIDLDGLEASNYKNDLSPSQPIIKKLERGIYSVSHTYSGITTTFRFEQTNMWDMINRHGIVKSTIGNAISNSITYNIQESKLFSSSIQNKVTGVKREDLAGIDNVFRHLVFQTTLIGAYGEEFATDAGNYHETNNIKDTHNLNGSKKTNAFADIKDDLVNNEYARNYFKNNNLDFENILTSKESFTNYLNDLGRYTLNSFDQFKNNPAYSDLLNGAQQIFSNENENVTNLYNDLKQNQKTAGGEEN
ncbi:MAG: RHS repeat-associated core domain-containing protein [Bacteroidetes bacterium]|nr:RHS repeat-associated core domain-containing protein [Bacteroidota bacterium]